MNIGEKIKTFREEKGLSQEEFATRISDTLENVIMYENGLKEPTLDKKLQIASCLDITLNELSYTIDHNSYKEKEVNSDYFSEEENKEEIVEEKEDLVIQTSIMYKKEVYDMLFGKSFKQTLIQKIIFCLCYIISGLYVFFAIKPLFGYFFFFFAIITFIKTISIIKMMKKQKEHWLANYIDKKREYYFYEKHLEVVDELGSITKFDNKKFYSFVDTEKYIVGMYNAEVPTYVIIDKSNIQVNDLEVLKNHLRSNIGNFVEESPELKKQRQLVKEHKALDIILWAVLGISVFIGLFARTIVGMFTTSTTFSVDIIVSILGMLFPIISFILGIFAQKKYGLKARKNIVIGIVVVAFYFTTLLLCVGNKVYMKKVNDYQLLEKLETTLEIELPDDFNTIYPSLLNKSNDNDTKKLYGEKLYSISKISVLTFNSQKELKMMEEAMNNSPYFSNVLSIEFQKSADLLSILKTYRLDAEEKVAFTSVINLDNNEINDVEDDTSGTYVLVEYYKTSGYMIITEFTYGK